MGSLSFGQALLSAGPAGREVRSAALAAGALRELSHDIGIEARLRRAEPEDGLAVADEVEVPGRARIARDQSDLVETGFASLGGRLDLQDVQCADQAGVLAAERLRLGTVHILEHLVMGVDPDSDEVLALLRHRHVDGDGGIKVVLEVLALAAVDEQSDIAHAHLRHQGRRRIRRDRVCRDGQVSPRHDRALPVEAERRVAEVAGPFERERPERYLFRAGLADHRELRPVRRIIHHRQVDRLDAMLLRDAEDGVVGANGVVHRRNPERLILRFRPGNQKGQQQQDQDNGASAVDEVPVLIEPLLEIGGGRPRSRAVVVHRGLIGRHVDASLGQDGKNAMSFP